jgi:hypothetical protein
MTKKTRTPTLTDDEIVTTSNKGRRRFLAMLGVGAVGAGALIGGVRPGKAQGATDQDSGNIPDQAGRGRGGSRGQTGLTDADNGNVTDNPGYGRGGPYTGESDSDPNDLVGHGGPRGD